MKFQTAVLLVGFATLAAFSFAQTAGSQPSPYVVRMHHLQDHEDTCILVRPDASYHLERTEKAKQVAYRGVLSTDELKELQALIDNSGFANIKNADINDPLIMSAIDVFEIAVPRHGEYQRLSFAGAESRQPFRKPLDPILSWFRDMKNDKRSVASTEWVNGCKPAAGPIQEESVAKVKNDFLVRVVVDHFGNGVASRTCVGVFPGGSYRREESSQEASDTKRVKVFEGPLTHEQVGEIRALLNAPELVSTVHRKLPSGIAMREGEITSVTIPRKNDIQNLIFATYFGERWSNGVPVHGSSSVDSAGQIIKPIREWVRRNIEKNKPQPIKCAVANDCAVVVSIAEEH